jgi:hypothetical protein
MLKALALAAAGCFSTVAPAGSTDSAPVLYRLNSASTYQDGCFPPCLCPIMIEQSLRGTFLLTPIVITGTYNNYQIDDVNLVVAGFDPPLLITGKGQYTIFAEFAALNRLELDLSVGGEPVQHFDSGWVTGGNDFPKIDIVVSINGMFCHDTVLHIDAGPLPAGQIIPFALARQTTYQQGCFDPCDCVLEQPVGMGGTFALVPLDPGGAGGAAGLFAVVNIDWLTRPSTPQGAHTITGTGIYKKTPAVAGSAPAQRMSLDLSVDGGDPTRFDSGLVPLSSPPGVIDVTVTMNDMVCFDIVLSLHAESTATPPASRLSNLP